MVISLTNFFLHYPINEQMNMEERQKIAIVFLREIIHAVKEVWEGPLFVRISADDYHPEGLTVNDYVQFAKWMKEQGVDLIDCSSGAVVPAHIDVYPGYQVKYAKHLKEHAQIATGAVGLITSGVQAEQILVNSEADLILLVVNYCAIPIFREQSRMNLALN